MATTLKKRPTAPANLSPEYLATLKWLTPIQAAAYLQMSRSTLIQLQRAKTVPFSVLSPRVIRFDRIALDAWAADNAVTA